MYPGGWRTGSPASGSLGLRTTGSSTPSTSTQTPPLLGQNFTATTPSQDLMTLITKP